MKDVKRYDLSSPVVLLKESYHIPDGNTNAKTTRILYLICLILLCAFSYSNGQGCFNSDFETGTLEGYDTYTGSINENGKVVVDLPESDSSRFKIFHLGDGFDPIAATYCEINSKLPVVPNGGGQFALRLGNPQTNAQAERVVLNINVTEDLTFFLLRYAVILNDPGHEDFEQPRFELRILDSQGKVFPCGVYKVRSGENIPGFENCGDWRVRPWTTAGLELKSFIGQNIQIEILTTDCSRGRHAGYAYIDATCQPLDIKLEGYCPNASSALFTVTEGFAKYSWNTGDTSNVIDIKNPEAGTPYFVTVTSSTGCQLVLSDTIPEFAIQPQPKFDTFQKIAVCAGDKFWLRPSGVGLAEIYSVDLGYSADSFLVSTQESTSYNFYAYDLFRCMSDTLEYHVNVLNNQVEAVIDSASCYNASDGAIRLINSKRSPYLIQHWSNGQTGLEIDDLRAGEYIVTIVDSTGCLLNEAFKVDQPAQLIIDLSVKDISCFGAEDGIVKAKVRGGLQPYRYNWKNIDPAPSILDQIDHLKEGSYELEVLDNNGCVAAAQIEISEPLELEISLSQDSVTCPGGNDGIAYASVSGGTLPYVYEWNDQASQRTNIARNLKAKDYGVRIVDDHGCAIRNTILIEEPAEMKIALSYEEISCYGYHDGKASAIATGGTPGYSYEWLAPANQIGPDAFNLNSGVQKLRIKDEKGCVTEAQITLSEPDPISIQPLEYLFPDCDKNIGGRTIIEATGGDGNYFFLWETGNTADTVESFIPGMKWVEVTDDHGCAMIDSVEVIGTELAVTLNGLISDFGYQEDFICVGSEVGLTVSANRLIDSIKWILPFSVDCDDCPTASGIPAHSFTYEINATDLTGCPVEKQGDVLVLEKCGTYIPNVFTPNGDGDNDRFYVVASTGSAKIKKFEIFNRWGNLMYRGKDLEIGNPAHGWDGTYENGEAGVGVYIYMVEISFLDMEEPVVFMGDVLLKK